MKAIRAHVRGSVIVLDQPQAIAPDTAAIVLEEAVAAYYRERDAAEAEEDSRGASAKP